MITANDASANRLSDKYGTHLKHAPRAVRMLAALLYDELRGRVEGAAGEVKFGGLFRFAETKPALADVRDALEKRLAPPHWPAPFAHDIQAPDSPLRTLLGD